MITSALFLVVVHIQSLICFSLLYHPCPKAVSETSLNQLFLAFNEIHATGRCINLQFSSKGTYSTQKLMVNFTIGYTNWFLTKDKMS